VETGLAGTIMSPFWILLELRMIEVVVNGDNWSFDSVGWAAGRNPDSKSCSLLTAKHSISKETVMALAMTYVE